MSALGTEYFVLQSTASSTISERQPGQYLSVLDLAFKVPLTGAAGVGVAVGLVMLTLSLLYEHRRLTPVVLSSYVATAMTGDSPGVTRSRRRP